MKTKCSYSSVIFNFTNMEMIDSHRLDYKVSCSSVVITYFKVIGTNPKQQKRNLLKMDGSKQVIF